MVTNASLVFEAVSFRVPKVYYIFLTCRIQSDEP